MKTFGKTVSTQNVKHVNMSISIASKKLTLECAAQPQSSAGMNQNSQQYRDETKERKHNLHGNQDNSTNKVIFS